MCYEDFSIFRYPKGYRRSDTVAVSLECLDHLPLAIVKLRISVGPSISTKEIQDYIFTQHDNLFRIANLCEQRTLINAIENGALHVRCSFTVRSTRFRNLADHVAVKEVGPTIELQNDMLKMLRC